MAREVVESKLLYFNDIPTKLGQITGVSVIKDGTGTDRGVFRVYPCYALVYFLEGTGEYADANGYRHTIVPGDFVLVTPDLPHRYATKPGSYWSECHVLFDGPVFDLCRSLDILNTDRPVCHLEPIDEWWDRLESVVTEPASQSLREKANEVTRLLALLMELFAADGHKPPERGAAVWLAAAKATLDANLEVHIDLKALASYLDVPYETFRKGFKKQFGVSPSLYRTQRRLTVARRLLKLTTMTHLQIAEYLGFSDEFHFSKRFKQIVGVGPLEYRRR